MTHRELFHFFEEQREVTQKRTAKGIEENRKADGKILVKDKNGNPIPDVRISVRQKNHAFRFGANLFMLDEFETEEKNLQYREEFKNVFNMATVPFYWNDLEPEEGKPRYAANSHKIYRRPAPDLCLDYCLKNGIEPREHALAYEHNFPQWLAGRSIPQIKKKLEEHFCEIARRYAEKIPTIEVTNEMNWLNSVTDFYYADDYMPWCYRMAEKYFPHNKLVINEGTGQILKTAAGKWSHYYMVIEKLLKEGCRIDAIGMQYHMFCKEAELYRIDKYHYYDPSHLFRTLDNYAELGKPIQMTEITIPAYSKTADDEALQADIAEQLYTLWFSHPAVEQIIYWNVVDGYAYGADKGDMTKGENYYHAGLLRFDMSRKPAFERLDELINHRWHTEVSLQSNEEGKAGFRGFKGEYTYVAERNGHKMRGDFSLKQDGDLAEIIL